MPTRLCLEPSCPNPVAYRGRCQRHARQRNRETRSTNSKIYNSKRWVMTRRHKLSLTPLCERCDDIATDVHHRNDIQAGGDIWNLDNLEALCHRCHSQETRRRQQ
jgi:5-methylcytosine-specific restriction endonuclease McrA